MALKRILLVHNYYGSSAPSGENQVFELEKALLQRRGHEVRVFTRSSDEIRRRGLLGAVHGAAATPWNPYTAADIRKLVQEYKPDIVHAHNTFPLISPSIFRAVGADAARVLTLHNYRLFCAAGIPLRDGKPCIECLEQKSAAPALRHACYRGSRFATAPLALGIELSRRRKTWQNDVEAFIALTQFQRDLMVASGLPPDRVFVKSNFVPGEPAVVAWNRRRPAVVFAGRLSEEKGVRYLLDAWAAWGAGAPELRIAGDGPLRTELETVARKAGSPVRFLGRLTAQEAGAEIGSARLLVLPSICFEGFPLVLQEAFALGTPMAVSDAGPLPGIVEDGVTGGVFAAARHDALLQRIQALWRSSALEALSRNARLAYEKNYTEQANYERLMAIYEVALARRQQRVDGLEH